jgi:hypothetical protein
MYISSKFKCQLSFNWHLNLSKDCATQPYTFNKAKCESPDLNWKVSWIHYNNQRDIKNLLKRKNWQI